MGACESGSWSRRGERGESAARSHLGQLLSHLASPCTYTPHPVTLYSASPRAAAHDIRGGLAFTSHHTPVAPSLSWLLGRSLERR